MMVRYDRATFNNGGPAPGTLQLWNVIDSTFSDAKSLGIYNNRNVRGASDTLSLHAEGRAVDVMVGDPDSLAEWARSHAGKYGIQEVIHYQRKHIWTGERDSEGWRPYKGPSNYKHVHIGQNRDGAGITATGKFRDPLIMAESYWEIVEAYGMRPYQVVCLAGAAALWVAIELGYTDRFARRIDKKLGVRNANR
jgi:hypothetical protein